MSLRKNVLTTLWVSGLFICGSAMAGVTGSKHDMTDASGTAQQTTTDSTSVCIFCHTPHKADTTAPAPLWNKLLASSGMITDYSTSTMDGSADIAGSVLLACLSCHDGTQAMDSVLNKPGSGGYVAAGSEISSADIGTMTGIANLGTDLSDDHPVSMPYAGDATWGSAEDSTDAGFLDKAFNPTTVINTRSFANGSLPLFQKGLNAVVECASCHDPHNTDNGIFMRIANTSSAVCTTCHVK